MDEFKKRQLQYQEFLTSAGKKLRVSKFLFIKILNKARANVALREDRRFYEFSCDYYLRKMILELGYELNIPETDIFNLTWQKLKNAKN